MARRHILSRATRFDMDQRGIQQSSARRWCVGVVCVCAIGLDTSIFLLLRYLERGSLHRRPMSDN
jgi:hypothetical protein